MADLDVPTIAEIRGMIARFLKTISLDLFPRDTKVLPGWTELLPPATPNERRN